MLCSTAGAVSVPTPSLSGARGRPPVVPPVRNAPFDEEPGFYRDAGLWLYGNVRLLRASLACVHHGSDRGCYTRKELEEIEREVETIVLGGTVLVTGIHHPGHMQAAVVPLRWGAPRILVLSGGFKFHLGEQLDQEPFRAARLWRYKWDRQTDLAISRRAPEKLPTYAHYNPTIDRLIGMIVRRECSGVLFDPQCLN